MKTFREMTPERLSEIAARFPQMRIAVIGDFFLDKYLDIDPGLAEVSLETGKTCHQVTRIRHSPGAAGTVVSNLSALGTGALYAIGFTGDDGESYDLRRDLAAMRCSTEHLICDAGRMTPTYLKPRDKNDPSLAGEHNRYDTKNRALTTVEVQERLVASVDALLPRLDALILMDQVEERDCGVITTRVAEAIAERARRVGSWELGVGRKSGRSVPTPNPQPPTPDSQPPAKVIFWVDSRRRIRQFRSVIIKPNQFEAVGWESPPPDASVRVSELVKAVRRLREEIGAPIVATRGAEGMLVSDPTVTLVPGVRVEGPIDPTGAGDSATAGTVLALAAGATLPEAAVIGNLVASITVQQLATTGVARPDELPPRLGLWLDQVADEGRDFRAGR
jgi:bifunctional ADP-heptose synthase (sugar kinase/adenylyltransferase)